MRVGAYLKRLDLGPGTVADRDVETLERLQRAHVDTVPFETLAITGDPWSDREGDGISLEVEDLTEKIVHGERGGFCYELNEAFRTLLTGLGFETERIAGAVLVDGEPSPPANHLLSLVRLDRPYVADVGLGGCPIRVPLPLDGSVRRDAAGIEWRIVESARPDAEYLAQYRLGDEEWTDRYVFRTVPRELEYVQATCEYLATAPESGFTGDPVVTVGTEEGYAKLTTEELTKVTADGERSRTIGESEWYDLLTAEFGLFPDW